jgi:hypothetical protein
VSRACMVKSPLPRMEQALLDMRGIRVRRVQSEEGCFVNAKLREQTLYFLTRRATRERPQ